MAAISIRGEIVPQYTTDAQVSRQSQATRHRAKRRRTPGPQLPIFCDNSYQLHSDGGGAQKSPACRKFLPRDCPLADRPQTRRAAWCRPYRPQCRAFAAYRHRPIRSSARPVLCRCGQTRWRRRHEFRPYSAPLPTPPFACRSKCRNKAHCACGQNWPRQSCLPRRARQSRRARECHLLFQDKRRRLRAQISGCPSIQYSRRHYWKFRHVAGFQSAIYRRLSTRYISRQRQCLPRLPARARRS